jgi:hypothetical protein
VLRSTMEDDPAMLMEAFWEEGNDWAGGVQRIPSAGRAVGQVILAWTGRSGWRSDKWRQGMQRSREEERY